MDVANSLLPTLHRALAGFWFSTAILFLDMVNLFLDDVIRRAFRLDELFALHSLLFFAIRELLDFGIQIFSFHIVSVAKRLLEDECVFYVASILLFGHWIWKCIFCVSYGFLLTIHGRTRDACFLSERLGLWKLIFHIKISSNEFVYILRFACNGRWKTRNWLNFDFKSREWNQTAFFSLAFRVSFRECTYADIFFITTQGSAQAQHINSSCFGFPNTTVTSRGTEKKLNFHIAKGMRDFLASAQQRSSVFFTKHEGITMQRET